ncbi:sensor histidine kinase [Streptomyces anulatus]|uniref:sensor histidine kinase n=1 Tax=Streptomyces anulatus TaxID=1892 RepID=UPI0038695AB0
MLLNPQRGLPAGAVRAACTTVLVLAMLTAVLTWTEAGWKTVVPMATTVVVTFTVLGWWPKTRPVLAPAAATVAAVTALGTLIGRPSRSEGHAGLMALVEIAVSLLMIFMVVRFEPPRRALPLGSALALSESTVLLRLEMPPTLAQALGQSAMFMLVGGGAAVVGGYLRSLDSRRTRSVHEARKAQRTQLAADLHDFVAHDVSGIVVLAQAAQVVGGTGRHEQVLPLLERIEAAGLQALASLDRTVLMLNASGADGASAGDVRSAPYGVRDIADLVQRFTTSGYTEVDYACALTDEEIAEVPREVAETAHRTVVEALTNVRRHAASTTAVRVSVRINGNGRNRALVVDVSNSAQAIGPVGFGGPRSGGGTGLVALTERVTVLGGEFTAGPYGDDGWRVLAALPLHGMPTRAEDETSVRSPHR